MLRITTFKEKNSVRFLVEGRLATESLEVLEYCWREANASVESQNIRVEFADITFVDDPAKELLQRMTNAGLQLSARDIHLKAILEKIKQNCKEEEL